MAIEKSGPKKSNRETEQVFTIRLRIFLQCYHNEYMSPFQRKKNYQNKTIFKKNMGKYSLMYVYIVELCSLLHFEVGL